jgi:DNA-binding HxlR family transcriptional regulator
LTVLEAVVDDKPVIEPPARAGGRTLSLFATPLNGVILRALAGAPLRQADLRAAAGSPPQTTLRGHLANLVEIGAIEKRKRDESSAVVDYGLTALGDELLFVADTLEAWLARAPDGPVALDSNQGKGAIKALTVGWGSTILRALGGCPRSLTELDRLIDGYSYPALERRLAIMRGTGQIEVLPARGKRTLYRVTDWTRHAVAPLTAAGRCEGRHMSPRTAPVTEVEVEAAFLLSLPLVKLPKDVEGACLFAVQTGQAGNGGRPALSGVRVKVEGGRLVSCVSELERDPSTWALGTVETWLDCVIDGNLDRLHFGGVKSPRLARDFVQGIHDALYG